MQLYYAAYSKDGAYRWKIYGYDATGNREEIRHRSAGEYDSAEEAMDACAEYMDVYSIDAEME